jgi:NAD(P)H-nitrite reductase large subunit
VKGLKYVIIGNSAAAIGCVEGIRSIDTAGEISIVSDEPHHTYSRPLISYLLLGRVTEEKMKYRLDGFYKENKCSLYAPETAVSIDINQKEVLLQSGASLPYDRLLLATGSSPFTPPMEGLDKVKSKHFFMSLDDAKSLASSINKDSRVLIIGAGLIGLKCAEGIRDRVKSIEVVDLAPRILSSILDDEGAQLVQAHLEREGLKFYLSNSVREFGEDSAALKDETVLGFDALVLAVGVSPNTKLAKDAGLAVNRGISATEKMETSVPGIYAAGDNTISIDVSSGQQRVLALLPNAYMQGEVAGINMAGGDASRSGAIPMNAIGFFGLHVLTAGSYDGDVHILRDVDGVKLKKLFVSNNALNGFIIIGDPSKAGIYTSLVRERTPLDSLDFELLKGSPGLAAFAAPARHAMLGGAH